MTFDELITNPVGSGSGNVAARYLIKNVIQSRSQALIEARRVTYKIYFDKDGIILIHFKVGSETFEKLDYDVVFELSPQSDVQASVRSVAKYTLRMMSNIPAFGYTYAYVLNQENMVIDFLKDKFSKEFWENPPTSRNPAQTFGFEKSLQFAALALKRAGMMDINQLKLAATSVSDVRKTIYQDFMPFASKLSEYQRFKLEANSVVKVRKDAAKETRSLRVAPSGKIVNRSIKRPNKPSTARRPQKGN